MHNLGTVTKFEITRTLKKKTFWLVALSFPVIAAFIGIIVYFSNQATITETEKLASEKYSIGILDESSLLNKDLLASLTAKQFKTIEDGVAAVKNKEIDGFFYYPSDLMNNSIQVYGQDVGLFKNGRYKELASQILKQSSAIQTSPNVQAALQGALKYTEVTYKANGEKDYGFMKVIAPGIFLVLFYFMLATFGNQILTSVTEEKENRVIEMILSTIKPSTLLVGKLISLIVLAIMQMIMMVAPVIVGYILFKDQLSIANFDISAIPLDAMRIGIGAVISTLCFFMFTAMLMTIGAAMPTAKEAGSVFGVVVIFAFGPLYAGSLFVSSPELPIVQFLSYFPLTSPIPLLLRNAVGNLELYQALISIAILIATTTIIMSIGVRIFRFGVLEYSRKLSFKEILKRKH